MINAGFFLFAELTTLLAESKSDVKQINALQHYFLQAPGEDHLQALQLLQRIVPPKLLSISTLKDLARREAQISEELMNYSCDIAGNTLEAISLILSNHSGGKILSLQEVLAFMHQAKALMTDERLALLAAYWQRMNTTEQRCFYALICGMFRVKLKPDILCRVLSLTFGGSIADWSARLYTLDISSYANLQALADDSKYLEIPRPVSFLEILPWDSSLEEGFSTERYSFHPLYAGKHVQLVVRNHQAYFWLAENVLLESAPKVFRQWAAASDDIHLEGTLIEKHVPLALQTDMNKDDSCFILFPSCDRYRELTPQSLSFIQYKELEMPDWRQVIHYCSSLPNQGVQALLIYDKMSQQLFMKKPKRKQVFAYLLYARKDKYGAFDEFSLGWKKGNDFLTMLRVQNTLEPSAAEEVSAWILQNTTERFGPVHMVQAQLVFEVSYESVSTSSRHKSGMILKETKLIGQVEGIDESLIGRLV